MNELAPNFESNYLGKGQNKQFKSMEEKSTLLNDLNDTSHLTLFSDMSPAESEDGFNLKKGSGSSFYFYWTFSKNTFLNNKCSLLLITAFLFFAVLTTMFLQSVTRAIPAMIFQMNLGHYDKSDYKLINYDSQSYMNFSRALEAISSDEDLKGVVIAPRMYKLAKVKEMATGIIALNSLEEEKFFLEDGFKIIGKGECILTSRLAKLAGVQEGDEISLEYSDSLLEEYLGEIVATKFGSEHRPTKQTYNISLKVIQVVSYHGMRIQTSLPYNLFVDINTFLEIVSDTRSKAVKSESIFNKYLSNQTMADYCSTLKFRLRSPEEIYYHSDTADTKKSFNKIAGKLELKLNIKNPEIQEQIDLLYQTNNKEVIINLLNCMLLTIFVAITLLCSYVISSIFGSIVLDKFRELSLLRLIGIRRRDLAGIYLLQSTIIGIVATVVAIPTLYSFFLIINKKILGGHSESYKIEFSKEAIFVGLFFSISIPFLSTLDSVFTASKHQIASGLDNSRPLNSMQVQIGPEDKRISNLVICFIVIIYGLGIYVMIPMTLIRGEFFITFFVLILLGASLCIGIGLLLMNLWKWANWITEHIILFFESKILKKLVNNTKSIHFDTLNKLAWTLMIGTALVSALYSMLVVILKADKLIELRYVGGNMLFKGNFPWSDLENWASTSLKNPDEYIQGFITNADTTAFKPFKDLNKAWIRPYQSTTMSNVGRTISAASEIRAVTPNFPHVGAKKFFVMSWKDQKLTSLNPFEYLYTRFGHGKTIIPEVIEKTLALKCDSQDVRARTFSVEYTKADKSRTEFWMNCFASAQDLPGIRVFSALDVSYSAFDLVTDIPTLFWLYDGLPGVDLSCLQIYSYLFAPHMGGNFYNPRVEELQNHFRRNMNNLSRAFFYKDEETENSKEIGVAGKINFVMTIIMYGIFMIKFTFGMGRLLKQQQKEIGIYKSIGMRARTIARLYFYEMYTMIICVGIYALFVSTAISNLFGLQLELFTQVVFEYTLPVSSFIYLFLGGFALSFVSVYLPVLKTAKKDPAEILRLPDS